MDLRPILLFAIAAACAGLGLADAAAQSYPNRPIKLVVPFPAGGPPDTIARLVGSDISARLGQSVVIDNRAGGGATIGTRAVANADPDGYTLLFASTTSLSIGPALFKNLDYDPVKSFAPVASVSLGALVVSVNADVPAKTLRNSSPTPRPTRASSTTAPALPPLPTLRGDCSRLPPEPPSSSFLTAAWPRP